MLNKEIDYYHRNWLKFRKLYPDKYLVFVGKKVIGVYNTHMDAYNATVQNYEVGTFLIKHILSQQG
jgi:hypothetical protein